MSAQTETMHLTMGQALVKFLQVQYSERDGHSQRLIPAMFGIFGHGNLGGLGQAVEEYGTELPFYQPFNEQSMVHTAVGYAKMTRRMATLACTSSIGPGATNMITGAATATINRLPALLLPSDYFATRFQGPVLQQLEHPISADVSVNDCFRPVSRFFDRILRPEQLLTALPEAMRVLTSPTDTGAVTLALPQDVQAEAFDYPAHFFEPHTWRVERPTPSAQRLREAVELLRRSERPLIIAGGGVHYADASTELVELANGLGIPVAETSAGKGTFTGDDTYLVGGLGVNGTPSVAALAREADLVIAVGTRLGDFATGSRALFQHPEVSFIGINVGALDAYKLGALPLVADAKLALGELLAAAREVGYATGQPWRDRIAQVKAAWRQQLEREVFVDRPDEAMSQGQLIKTVNDFVQPGDVVVAAAGTLPGDLVKLWDAGRGTLVHLEYGNSCMGYEIPGAMGVKLAAPEREVYVLVGDGTYLLNNGEIINAVREGLKITLVVPVNHGYQSIRGLQAASTGTTFATEFRERDSASSRLEGSYLDIDIVSNAESMGAVGFKADSPESLRDALAEARGEQGAAVIVAEVEPQRSLPDSTVWWEVPTVETSGRDLVRPAQEVFAQGRAKQRLYY